MSDSKTSPHGSDGLSSPVALEDGSVVINGAADWKPGATNQRKRKAGPSSRGVANLTPEQLEKKRANDREAQRAIRERTKIQIESLERRIAELTSTEPYQEMQDILRQKELVELENADIKRRLAAVLELIQPILANNSSRSGPGAAIEAMLDNSTVNGHTGMEAMQPDNAITMGLSGTNTAKSSPASWHMAAQSPADLISQRTSSTGNKRGSFGRGISGLLRRTSEDSRDMGELLSLTASEDHGHNHAVESNTISSIPPSLPADHHVTLASPITMSHGRPTHQSNLRNAPWQNLPPWGPPSSVFDGLLREFTLSARQRHAQGVSEFELLGPMYPNFAAITYPRHDIPCHPISRFLRDILAPFPDMNIITNKVGIAYIMFLILRWHICPTPQNFDRLPHWGQPNSWQLTITHSFWIDHVPWPEMRTEMIRNPHLYLFDRFFVPHSKTESINWDHGESAMYVRAEDVNDADGSQVLSHAFESHIRDLDNWTLGPAFAKEFPSLAAHCRITTRGEDERREQAEKQALNRQASSAGS